MNRSVLISLIMLPVVSCSRMGADMPSSGDGSAMQQAGITVSLPDHESRTSLGTPEGGRYKTLWSEGDCISVNGISSDPVAAADAGRSTAGFTFRGFFKAPCNLLYPASAEADVVEFLSEQNYSAGSFSPGSTPMWASMTELSDATLLHLGSLLRFDIKGNVKLSGIHLSARGGEPVCGKFRMEKDASGAFTGAFSPLDGEAVSAEMDYSFPDGGLQLSGTAVPVYIAIPSGRYSAGFTAVLASTEGEEMVVSFFSDGERTVQPSRVLHFSTEVNFNPGGDGNLYVHTEEDLAGLPSSCASKAYIMEDISLSSSWEAIAGFSGSVDGLGHTLTSASSAPVFNVAGAGETLKVSNLSFRGPSTEVFVKVSDGKAVFKSCAFSDNPGGFTVSGGSLELISCNFNHLTNRAVGLTGGRVSVSDSEFMDNCLNANQACCFAMTGGDLDVSGSKFCGNGAGGVCQKGAITLGNSCSGSTITFNGCLFDGNRNAASSGSVITMAAQFAGILYCSNCIFAGNVNVQYGNIHQSANTTATGDTGAFLGFCNCLFYDNYGTSANGSGTDISIAGRHCILNSTFISTAAHKSIMNLRCGALGQATVSVGGAKSSVIVNNVFVNEAGNCFDAGAANKYYQTLLGYNRYNSGANATYGGVSFDSLDSNVNTAYTYRADDHLWTWTPSADDTAAMFQGTDIRAYVNSRADESMSGYLSSYFDWLEGLSCGTSGKNPLVADLYGNVRTAPYWPGCYQGK